jgi:undecaprenyl-diphosphatase
MTSELAKAKAAGSRFARLHPTAYVSLSAVIGFAIALLCAWLFVAIADAVPEKGALDRVDAAVTGWFQIHHTARGTSIFLGVSWLGVQAVALLFCVAVGWLIARRDVKRIALLCVAVGGAWLLDWSLKAVFHRPRPEFAFEFVNPASWSFPSGHALESLVAYGLLAHLVSTRYPAHRIAIDVAAAVLIVLIGFSRLYLGVHYLSDVVAGYAAGFVWLTACITGFEFAGWRRRRAAPA